MSSFVVAEAAGACHTAAVTAGGRLVCSGRNSSGQCSVPGPSLIRAFGNYSGGELFHEDDNGDAYYKLKEGARRHPVLACPANDLDIDLDKDDLFGDSDSPDEMVNAPSAMEDDLFGDVDYADEAEADTWPTWQRHRRRTSRMRYWRSVWRSRSESRPGMP